MNLDIRPGGWSASYPDAIQSDPLCRRDGR
jgi:hypothetical protein